MQVFNEIHLLYMTYWLLVIGCHPLVPVLHENHLTHTDLKPENILFENSDANVFTFDSSVSEWVCSMIIAILLHFAVVLLCVRFEVACFCMFWKLFSVFVIMLVFRKRISIRSSVLIYNSSTLGRQRLTMNTTAPLSPHDTTAHQKSSSVGSVWSCPLFPIFLHYPASSRYLRFRKLVYTIFIGDKRKLFDATELGWTHPCDVWSIGCIIFELYTGYTLFQVRLFMLSAFVFHLSKLSF